KIAALRRRQGRWKEAIAGMRKAHALDPQNPFPAPDLAFMYCSLRDWPAAMQAFDRVVTLAPDSGYNQSLRAYFDLWSRGDTARAKALLKNIPGRGAEDLLAWARWDINLVERNFAAAEQVVSAGQSDPLAAGWGPPLPKSYLQGCVDLARGESARALVRFEKARPIFESYVREASQNAIRH